MEKGNYSQRRANMKETSLNSCGQPFTVNERAQRVEMSTAGGVKGAETRCDVWFGDSGSKNAK